jgi:hypothetical protein
MKMESKSLRYTTLSGAKWVISDSEHEAVC